MGFIDLFIDRPAKKAAVKPKASAQQPSPLVVDVVQAENTVTGYTVLPPDYEAYVTELKTYLTKVPDLATFLTMKDAMKAIPQEEVRYVAAYAGWSASGKNKDILLKSANDALSLLSNELTEFKGSYDRVFETSVNAPKKEIAKKAEEIQALTQKISKLNGEIAALDAQSNEANVDLAQKKTAFDVAFNSVKSEIESEIQKINNFIKQ